jgi:hypothetical protein
MAKKRHNAGAFDIRAIIAYLLGIYGLVLVCLGLFDYTDVEKEKSGDFNVNLWGGLAMVIVAAVFLIWNKLQPTKVPDDQIDESSNEPKSR